MGTALKTGEVLLKVSPYDKVFYMRKDGAYRVVNVSDREFIGTEGLYYYALADKDELSKVVFTAIYKEKESKFYFLNRFTISSFTTNKLYSILPKGNYKLVKLATFPSAVITAKYKTGYGYKVLEETFRFSDFAVRKSPQTVGYKLITKALQSLTLRQTKETRAAREMMMRLEERILFEDNHLIIINKECGELVQGDDTGDRTLADDVKAYLKKKYNKPGNVYLGVPHRLDRPTSGVMVYARTEKALVRMNEAFRADESDVLTHYIVRDSKANKSTAHVKEVKGSRKAVLKYTLLASSNRYHLLEIELYTGRHHQIRAQLKATGLHIKGDLKYGFPRSNPDGGICLHSRKIVFSHPVRKEELTVVAPPPKDALWDFFLSTQER